eukprot:TRINITY_DN20565_c0_g1_i10.p1 TRINITY_DN20565_c0_g1~~TRINITY_DN20565_c0_g1_i10.p1  ORF type:complete len:265 (-),score=58.69 TRINITY_DN20565_c0_g1_i10:321-1115(-)
MKMKQHGKQEDAPTKECQSAVTSKPPSRTGMEPQASSTSSFAAEHSDRLTQLVFLMLQEQHEGGECSKDTCSIDNASTDGDISTIGSQTSSNDNDINKCINIGEPAKNMGTRDLFMSQQNSEASDCQQAAEEQDQEAAVVMVQECMDGHAASTNLMLRNLPCRMKAKDVIAMVHELGYAGTFDSVQVPAGRGKGNRGYAFINFQSIECARVFMEAFVEYRFEGHNTEKTPSICWSVEQDSVLPRRVCDVRTKKTSKILRRVDRA